ncbi:MAG: hypothetical protein ABSG62_14090 [Terracidiphilus sp.]
MEILPSDGLLADRVKGQFDGPVAQRCGERVRVKKTVACCSRGASIDWRFAADDASFNGGEQIDEFDAERR